MGVKTDTRQRMITSAAQLREKGVAGTSIAEVLRHSRGPRGSVGFHFPGGRAELLTDALRWAGCPVGAAAQEAYGDPVLGALISSIIDDWHTGLAEVLTRAGHDPDAAADLAMLCISALEGAITMSRVKRSTEPIDTVPARVVPLLVTPA